MSGMLAYKAFNKGLICRGYKFKAGITSTTEEANCVRNGFHAAEDPLDMFTYYPNTETSEYWIVKLGGDMHEDGRDSKIACTELTPVRRLKPEEIAAAALLYIKKHPQRTHRKEFLCEWFKLAYGNSPELSGNRGQYLAFAVKCKSDVELSIFQIDGQKYKERVLYNAYGEEVCKDE